MVRAPPQRRADARLFADADFFAHSSLLRRLKGHKLPLGCCQTAIKVLSYPSLV
jgi:hypothetical protein